MTTNSDEPAFYGFLDCNPHETAMVTVAFRTVPGDLERLAETVSSSSISFGYRNHFRWSGAMLMFEASARSRGHLRNWVRAVHPRDPIIDVVFHSSGEGAVEAGQPQPQPRSTTWLLGVRPFSEELPDWTIWKRFEDARTAAAKRAQHQHSRPKLLAALAKQKKSHRVRFELIDDAKAPAWTDARFDAFDLPRSRFVFFEGNTQGHFHQLAAGDHPILNQSRAVAQVVKEPLPTGSLSPGFAWISEGKRQEFTMPALDCSAVTLHPTEPKALVCSSGMVLEVALDRRESTLLPQVGASQAAGWMADGYRITVGDQIVLFDADHQPVFRVKGSGFRATVIAGGRAVLVEAPKNKLQVYALAGGKLTLEGELAESSYTLVCSHGDAPELMLAGGALRIVGLAERIAALTSKPSRKKSLAFETRTLTPLPAVPSSPSPVGKPPVEDATVWSWSPSGEWAAYRLADDKWLHVRGPGGVDHFHVDYDPDAFQITDEGTVMAHDLVGLRFRWDGPRTFQGTWPGAKAEDTSRPLRFDLLAGIGLAVFFRPGGEFQVWALEGASLQCVWSGRGFSEAFEVDGALVVCGALGTYHVGLRS